MRGLDKVFLGTPPEAEGLVLRTAQNRGYPRAARRAPSKTVKTYREPASNRTGTESKPSQANGFGRNGGGRQPRRGCARHRPALPLFKWLITVPFPSLTAPLVFRFRGRGEGGGKVFVTGEKELHPLALREEGGGAVGLVHRVVEVLVGL